MSSGASYKIVSAANGFIVQDGANGVVLFVGQDIRAVGDWVKDHPPVVGTMCWPVVAGTPSVIVLGAHRGYD